MTLIHERSPTISTIDWNENSTNKNGIVSDAHIDSQHRIFLLSSKAITITVERLSDHSRITFTISSDKTIEQLRALLNHHLPPLSPGKFDLYSYQRGALIHFHPSSFKLDYFPVIFDQSVLLLKMDDRPSTTSKTNSPKLTRNRRRRTSANKDPSRLINDCLSSPSNTFKSSPEQTSSSSTSSQITCLSLFKQFFQRSSSNHVNTDGQNDLLTY